MPRTYRGASSFNGTALSFLAHLYIQSVPKVLERDDKHCDQEFLVESYLKQLTVGEGREASL